MVQFETHRKWLQHVGTFQSVCLSSHRWLQEFLYASSDESTSPKALPLASSHLRKCVEFRARKEPLLASPRYPTREPRCRRQFSQKQCRFDRIRRQCFRAQQGPFGISSSLCRLRRKSLHSKWLLATLKYHLQNNTATWCIFEIMISNISSVTSSISSELVWSSIHLSSSSSFSRLPSYTVGIPFSKYKSFGSFSMPYSFASSTLSIFTKAMPSWSHSSSMFSNSARTLSDFLSLLSSIGGGGKRIHK